MEKCHCGESFLNHDDILCKYRSMNNNDIERIYNLITPICLTQFSNNGMLGKLVKPEFNQIGTKAYMWDDAKIKYKIQINNNNLYTMTGKLLGTYVETITTYHSWSYYGFFKPDLKEVITQFPQNLVEINEPIFVTTEPYSNNIHNLIHPTNRYHIGKTSIWLINSNIDDNLQ